MDEKFCNDSVFNLPEIQEFLKEQEEYKASLVGLETDAILAAPLFDMSSINIYSNNGQPSEVYGTIRVTDGEGATFDLYNREKNEPEIVSTGSSLTLSFSEDLAISPSGQVEVEIDIKDRVRRAVIAKGRLCCDYKNAYDYDKVHTFNVDGECGFAAILYVTYRHAVIATVDVALVKGSSDDASCLDADIYGKIVAHCGNNFSSTLFEKKENQSVKTQFESFIELSKHVVAVSVSSLVIEAELWNRDTRQPICSGKINLHTEDYGCEVVEKIGGQHSLIEVVMDWSHLYMQPPLERIPKRRIEDACNGDNKDNKKPRYDQRSSRPLIVDRYPTLDLWNSPFLLLEVFSVVISGSNSNGVNVWGSIKVHSPSGDFLIYDNAKTSPEKFLPNQIATIKAPPKSIAGDFFDIIVNLKDPDDHIICACCAVWNERTIERPIPWCDRQLCSVFRGDIGYAAVHYTLFSAGVQATVKVHLVSQGFSTNSLQVHGSIFTEYSNYKYVTKYERDCYRSRLFLMDAENPIMLLSPNFEVPLSKSVVVVPQNAFLIVDLDLTVTFSQTTDDILQVEALRGQLKFDSRTESDQRISGSRGDIHVSVEWS